MSNNMYRFETTVEFQGLREIFALPGTEWAAPFTVQEFAQLEAKKVVDRILAGRPARGFCLRSKQTNEVVATCLVVQNKALYKDPSVNSIGHTPDPASFGVQNATALLVSYVFVASEHRGKGLMQELVQKAIKYTEDEILQKELAKSSDSKDSFRSMVQSGRDVDQDLVHHYLGKKYFWYLYSAIGSAYTKVGFKAFPLEGYRLGFDFAQRPSAQLVQALLQPGGSSDAAVGKSLRLLDGAKQADLDTIVQILHGQELELLTELNKNLFHSELAGSRRSSSSMMNLQHVLRRNSLSRGSFSGAAGGDQAAGGGSTCGKFAVVPSSEYLDNSFFVSRELARRYGTAANQSVADIRGAILTNEMQHRSFYILWKILKQKDFHIVGMGEVSAAGEFGLGHDGARRRSFTAINDLGGHNFQDVELLLAAAVHIARQETVNGTPAVYVALNDLPAEIPAEVMHDFFMNYLGGSAPVDFVPDFSSTGTLPMLRKYGSNDSQFDLDWVSNSLAHWG